uniref:Pyrimidine nucleoside phosphorylase C-terminal domain-containing protein n=1 Tax=Lygus hesperus TaxID=30085 RepID=A0A0K8T0Y0_LYGHE
MSRNSDIVALLAKKRRGKELTDSEIDDFVMMTVKNAIDGSQIGAMLMAIAIRGLSKQETASLTKSMAHSGHVFKWDFEVCDKHSTGGVGDKISIPLAPALAALGVKVPMLSGRGLDLTGGTLDKLESIPGFRVNLSIEELTACINECGVFIASPTNNLCTADKVLYSFRDVTATADCDGLIVGGKLMSMSGKAKNDEEGQRMIREVIENGKALEKFREMMVQQGVDPVVAKTLCYDDYRSILPVASKTTDILATKSGWVTGMNSLTIAKVLRDLGAGRRSPQDKLDLAAGMVLLAERGDSVQEGTPWLRVHHNVDLTEQQKSELGGALVVSKERSLTSTSRILLTI